MICHHCIRGALRNRPGCSDYIRGMIASTRCVSRCDCGALWEPRHVSKTLFPQHMFKMLKAIMLSEAGEKEQEYSLCVSLSHDVLGWFWVTGEAVIYIQRREAVTRCLSSKAGSNPLSRFPVSRFKRVKVLSAYTRTRIKVPVHLRIHSEDALIYRNT